MCIERTKAMGKERSPVGKSHARSRGKEGRPSRADIAFRRVANLPLLEKAEKQAKVPSNEKGSAATLFIGREKRRDRGTAARTQAGLSSLEKDAVFVCSQQRRDKNGRMRYLALTPINGERHKNRRKSTEKGNADGSRSGK